MATLCVTGTSSGFGREIALALLQAGHRVYAGMRGMQGARADAAAALRAAAEQSPGELIVLDLDVTSDASVDAAVARIIADGHGIDVLVNNAGIAAGGITETFTPADLQRIFDVNFLGVVRMCRAVLPAMRAAGGGLIVNISSTLGREVTPFLAGYVASKHALEAFFEAFRYELAPQGIECVQVQPGTFPTTAIVANLLAPSEPERAAAHPALQPVVEGFFGGLAAYAGSGHAPAPALVAQEVVALCDMPRGTRPTRVVVDPQGPGGAARLNALADEVQRDVLRSLQLESLLPLPAAAE